MTFISMRAGRFYRKIDKFLSINTSDTISAAFPRGHRITGTVPGITWEFARNYLNNCGAFHTLYKFWEVIQKVIRKHGNILRTSCSHTMPRHAKPRHKKYSPSFFPFQLEIQPFAQHATARRKCKSRLVVFLSSYLQRVHTHYTSQYTIISDPIWSYSVNFFVVCEI